jgi:very-long-chain ceramide synthase
METRHIVDLPVDLLRPAVNSRKGRLRRLSRSQSKDAKSNDTPSISPTHRSSKERTSAKQRKEQQSTSRRWKLPLLSVVLILSFYGLSPSESNPVHPLIFLSYQTSGDPNSSTSSGYGKGPLDIAFVAFYTLVLFVARELIMQEILRPLAVLCGITSHSKQARFNEQVYVAIYTGIVGPLGLWVMAMQSDSDNSIAGGASNDSKPTTCYYYYYNCFSTAVAAMYRGYPHATLAAPAKAYYLVQAAFWAQQALVMVLGLERRRRDFRELVVHHVVTVALVALSYRFHFTVMGVLVFVTHDISDFFLAVSCFSFFFPFHLYVSSLSW